MGDRVKVDSSMDTRFKTSADIAYEVIRDKIISGGLEPGAKLTRRGMAELTGVSIIPVIEALHRLEDEGLVDSEPHYGARVIEVTQETIRDKFAMRLAIECQVARMLAKHHTDEQVRRLQFLAEELDSTSRQSADSETLRQRHYEFHLALAENTGCRSLVQALQRLNLFDLLQQSVAKYTITHTEPPKKDHHKKIVVAVERGDPDEAESVMRAHVYFSGLLSPEDL